MSLADRVFQPLANAAIWLLFRSLDRKLCDLPNLTADDDGAVDAS